ncbi:MAG: NAD-dependent epimerase/dehydratase family protein [Prolixibacteraceae bacterium]|nr:NAD-dependent epimerase/dehydratase family protein [Prolixibacteraceae bacterium]
MKILITGIHGFVGNNIVSRLKNQHTIFGLDIVSPIKDGVVKTYDWNELKKIPSIDCVIHLAGKAHDTKNQTNPQVYFDINTRLTQQIFDWFLTTNAQKFIFFSSVKAAADQVDGDILTEDVTPTPKGPYGESKMAAEQYILNHLPSIHFATQGADFGLPSPVSGLRSSDKRVYILRPCMIHGPGNKGNLNLLYQVQQKGLPWPLGAYQNKRSFCAVDNLKFVIQQIIEKNIEPGIYQVADDEALSTNELIQIMADSQNKKAKIWRVPPGLIKTLAHTGDFFHLPLNSERLKKLTESYVVSNQKLKTALGIEKMPVTAKEGLRKTLESFKE